MKIALAAEGGHFADRALDVELHWGRGGGDRLVAVVPDDAADSNPGLAAALASGQVVIVASAPKASKPPAIAAAKKTA